MKPHRSLVAVVTVVLAALALSCGGDGQEGPAPSGIVIQLPSPGNDSPTPRPTKTTEATPNPSPAPLKVCAPNPDPARPSLLQVEEPKPDQQVKLPVQVRGWGSNIGFQDQGVAVAIVNAKQEVLQVLDVPPQPRTFRVPPPELEITEYTKPFAADLVIDNLKEPTSYCLWVYQDTTIEGTPKGVVQVPVTVLPR